MHIIWGLPQTGFFAYYIYVGGGGGGFSQVSYFAYCMGAHLDQFLRLIWEAPSDYFFCILYGGPLKSFYLLTIWGPTQTCFFAYHMGALSDLCLCYYLGGPLRSVLCLLYGGPPQVSFFAYCMGAPQISFFIYYMGPPPMPVSSLAIYTFLTNYWKLGLTQCCGEDRLVLVYSLALSFKIITSDFFPFGIAKKMY